MVLLAVGPSRTGWVERGLRENFCLGQCLPPALSAAPSQRDSWRSRGLGLLGYGLLPLTGLMVLGKSLLLLSLSSLINKMGIVTVSHGVVMRIRKIMYVNCLT